MAVVFDFFIKNLVFLRYFAKNHAFLANFARKSHFLCDKKNDMWTLNTSRLYNIHLYEHYLWYNISSEYILMDPGICFVIRSILYVPQPFKYDISRDNWKSKFSSFGQKKNALKNHIFWMEGATVIIYLPKNAEFDKLWFGT